MAWQHRYCLASGELNTPPWGVPMPLPDLADCQWACWNRELAVAWGLPDGLLAGDKGPPPLEALAAWMKESAHPVAMAYAGHQYGHPTMLGDGRALLVGEWPCPEGQSLDLHLKGSGPTPYARGGDGWATLSSVLREYLMSEALAGLGVPVTRSLFVLETARKVWRDYPRRGGLLGRVAPHHLRIGTLEYAASVMHVPEYAKTVGWVMDRCRADWQVAPRDRAGAAPSPDEVEEFVMEWMRRQAFLLAEWNRVGFVHGVLNTDNISLAGLTLDLGPCAMINGYDPERSFSSIDHAGRYAFGRQGEVMEWNSGVLLSCLLPLLDPEPLENPSSRAVEKAGRLLASFQSLYKEALFEMHGRKLGLHAGSQHHTNSNSLIGDWLSFLTRHKADYSLSYMDLESRLLSRFTGVTGDGENDAFWSYAAPQVPPMDWVEAWLEAVSMDPALAVKQMRQANPTLIPRNHLVEEVLDAWVRRDDPLPLNEFLGLLRDPYLRSGTVLRRNQPPPGGDEAYCTYCGT